MDTPCICLAHRGASGYEPENTIRSFTRALELGASWIELDVRIVEGEPIVFHDRTLTRMANCAGIVEKQTLARIRSLTLPKDEKIPLLQEVLSIARGRAGLQIELKGPGSGAVVANTIHAALRDGWDPQSFLVSAFDQDELLTFKKAAPTIPLGLLTYGYPMNILGIADKFGAVSVHLHIDATTPARIKHLQNAGLKVFVYTANDPSDISTLRGWGVDGIFSDFPDRVSVR